jgi:hypothetical protein
LCLQTRWSRGLAEARIDAGNGSFCLSAAGRIGVAMTMTTADSYAAVISQRVTEEQRRLAAQWLDRLKDILSVDCNDVFPSADLLDHIPLLVGEVAAYLRAPADEEIAANAAVIAKARELGMLRHAQHASVHQLLREYEILSEILEAFVAQETRRLDLQPTSEECFDVLQRLTRSTRALMRTTVDTFVSEYTSTIQERNERINTFHRMASHEMRSPIGTASRKSRRPYGRMPSGCRGWSTTCSGSRGSASASTYPVSSASR